MDHKEHTFPDEPLVVVADGNPDEMCLISDTLRRHDLRVMGFIDCRKAFTCIEQERPKLVIVDLSLPHGEGDELVRKIREDERQREVPVVVVVSGLSEKERLEGMFDAALQRPFDEKTLLLTLERFLPGGGA